MRFSDVLLGWVLVSDVAMYTFHRRPVVAVHLAAMSGTLYLLSLAWRLAATRRWRFDFTSEFGPGPWDRL